MESISPYKPKLLYFLYLVACCSLFATCRKSGTSTGIVSGTAPDVDSIELEINPVDDFAEDVIPTRISLATKDQFIFARNKNSYAQNYFRNPFDSAIYVSGTFCELRGNHFHAGLDIRTGSREGWPVLAAAGGYVSRVKVSNKGYGRVVYISHPNGFTTVYGHLQGFKGALANYVKEQQYKQRKFQIELYPNAGTIPIQKGQNFALSGNTGGSAGPHLHFEIRNARGESTNPLLHGLQVVDKLKPVIKKVSIYQKDKNKLEQRGAYPYKTLNPWSEYLKNTKTLNAKPANYSFGLYTDDYFTDKNNVLGINYCWLTANGKLLYEYQIEKFKFSQGRYIYTHTDPYLKWKEGRAYIRLFKEKFNPLPYYKQNQNGEIRLKQGDSVQLKLYIQDYAGLVDSASWIMVGDTTGLSFEIKDTVAYEQKYRVRGGENLSFYEWKIAIPKKAVYHPFDFKLRVKAKKPKMLSKTLQMHYPYTPLHSYAYIKYTVPAEWLHYGSKLCAVSFDGKKMYYEGGTLSGNILSFKTRSLGEYAITFDNEPPIITKKSLGRKFIFRVTENLSKIDKIICTIDGKWILAQYEPKTNTVWGEIPNWIKKGSYKFELKAIDGKQNKSTFSQKITL